jgi:hypothetical protein
MCITALGSFSCENRRLFYGTPLGISRLAPLACMNNTGVAESPMIHESPVRVVVAHEHPIFRYGLKLLLEETRGVRVVGEAADGVHAVELSRELQADVLLMDLAIPAGGFETLRSLAASAPSVRPIVLIGA